jgi:hypothetical protein
MLRKGKQFLLHMFISSSWEFYFKIYSNTANYKLWTSMAGTLQTQLVIVVFICTYLYSITVNFEIEFPRTRNEHVEQELLTLPEHLSSPPVLSGVLLLDL